jgi:ornithine cyclodeaminase/alanine dehydrogenase-like protein (mu-crystallin family)
MPSSASGAAHRATTRRRSTDEITLFRNVGGGHLDLFTARYLSERLGQEVRAEDGCT